MNWTMRTLRPWPTARKAVPGAAKRLEFADSGAKRQVGEGDPKTAEGILLRELEASDEFVHDGGDALLRHWREGRTGLGMRILENDPQPGAVALVVAGADGAGELSQLERHWRRMSEVEIGVFRRVRLEGRMGEQIHEDAAGIIDEVAETLRDEDGVHVARCGVLELMEVVVGKRALERNFDGGRRPIGVGRDADGHGLYGFTLRTLFRVGAAGEDGESAVELFGEHDAGEFVGESHGAEGKLLVGALAEIFGEAVGVAAKEDQFAGAAVAKFPEPFGEGVRSEIFSGSVEKDYGGGAIRVEFLQCSVCIADFSDFQRTRAADALFIIFEDGAHFGAAGLAQHDQPEFHLRPYFFRFSSSVLRLMPRASAERLIW